MGKLLTHIIIVFSWSLCLTYFIGSTSYKTSIYVYKFGGIDDEIEQRVWASCFTTTAFALVGSILAENRVTHIFWALTISIPLGLVVPFISGYSVYSLRFAGEYNEETIRQAVDDQWGTNSTIVPFLTAIQRDQKCCGLYSPTDYREFIYKGCENILEDIPESCVDLRILFDKCRSSQTQKDFCYVYNFTRDAIIFKDASANDLVNNMTLEEGLKYKCKKVNASNARVNNVGLRTGTIYSKGCMGHIIGNNYALRNAHYFFFFLVAVLSLTIVISFLSLWFNNAQKAKNEHLEAEEKVELKSHTKTIGYITES